MAQGDKVKVKWRQERAERFRILHRDTFVCRYCGAKPGSEFLEVDHLIPRARGGSDNDINLVTACKTCNRRKSDSIVFPHDLIERQDDEDGWFVHKSFGLWTIVFCDQKIGVDMAYYGFIESQRLFDVSLISHIHETKTDCFVSRWGASVMRDMEICFSYLRQMIVDIHQ
jgi:hypothetical protein